VFRFQFFQFVEEAVELWVADFGIVENVVAVLVIANLVAECVDFFLDRFLTSFGLPGRHSPRIIGLEIWLR